eukprot:3275481-Amphidinium_carterae.1
MTAGLALHRVFPHTHCWQSPEDLISMICVRHGMQFRSGGGKDGAKCTSFGASVLSGRHASQNSPQP